MLTSIVFLETSIPNTPSITVLSFHFSKSSASNNLVHRIYAHARPKIPFSLDSGAWKTGPNLPHGLTCQRDDRGSPFSSLLSKVVIRQAICNVQGTCVSSHAPRTDPYVRLSRIRLPPQVSDGRAIARHLPYAFQRL